MSFIDVFTCGLPLCVPDFIDLHIKGVISDWGSWESCSASCQLDLISPTRTRTRTCTGSSFGGNCNGQVLTSSENCNVEVLCPGLLCKNFAVSVYIKLVVLLLCYKVKQGQFLKLRGNLLPQLNFSK